MPNATVCCSVIALSAALAAPAWSQSAGGGAAAPAAAPAPCSTPEFRQLDFWVGDWDAEWDNPDGSKGTAKYHFSRDEFGDCVIYEHFSADDGSLKGMSISTYAPAAHAWRQTWVDASGGYFDLSGGPVSGQAHSFELQTLRLGQSPRVQRMIWEKVTSDSFVWRWQARASDDAAWVDSWVLRYRRHRPA
jgi:hypothetical protein